MYTVITARHCAISDDLRRRTQSVIDHLTPASGDVIDAAVVFDTTGSACTAELRMHLAHEDLVVAHGSALDHRSALDLAEVRIRRQLTRLCGRSRARRHGKVAEPE